MKSKKAGSMPGAMPPMDMKAKKAEEKKVGSYMPGSMPMHHHDEHPCDEVCTTGAAAAECHGPEDAMKPECEACAQCHKDHGWDGTMPGSEPMDLKSKKAGSYMP